MYMKNHYFFFLIYFSVFKFHPRFWKQNSSSSRHAMKRVYMYIFVALLCKFSIFLDYFALLVNLSLMCKVQ